MRGEWHVGSRFEITIEGLAAGGDGVGRADGCVVFVPGAAPGDVLLVEVERVEARRLHARAIHVRTPASVRREARCEHFGKCGGCAWQHVGIEAQRAAKARLVGDALERLGGIRTDAPIEVRAGNEYGWRSRAQLRIETGAATAPRIGWLRRGSHELEVVSACPVLAPALQRTLDEIQSGARPVPSRATSVRLCGDEAACTISFQDASGKTLRPRDGGGPASAAPRFTVGRFEYQLDAEAFFQGNAGMLATLVDTALEGCVPKGAQSSALDLYCGSGLFTLPLSERFDRVLGIEGDARSIDLARANARANDVQNARFECDDVAKYLERARRVLEPEVVLLDPPRRGAGTLVVDRIAELGPLEVRYVSCDPATLARDLARFVEHEFTLTSIVALDLFPQTPHVECVAVLRRATVG